MNSELESSVGSGTEISLSGRYQGIVMKKTNENHIILQRVFVYSGVHKSETTLKKSRQHGRTATQR